MNFAYADPPYIGQAKKHYRHDPRCAEVDHADLIRRLSVYDGFALSCSTPSLQYLLSLCPSDVRIAAWVKPFCSFKPGVNPAYAWEPVIWKSSRVRSRDQITVRDFICTPITLQKGLAGAKPLAFCFWIFDLLNLQNDDRFDDLFPGTGIVMEAFMLWKGRLFQ